MKMTKALDNKISAIAQKAVKGYIIPMLSIPAIYQAGKLAALDGGDDAAIEAAIKAKIEAVAVN